MKSPSFIFNSRARRGKALFSVKVFALIVFLFLAQQLAYHLSGAATRGLVLASDHPYFSRTRPFPFTQHSLDEIADSQPDILYFSDSTAYPMPVHGPTGPYTHELIQSEFEGCRVRAVTHEGFNTEIFLKLMRYLNRKECRPGLIILPINVRAFGASWHINPLHHAGRLRKVLDYGHTPAMAFVKPLIVFDAIELNLITEEEYQRDSREIVYRELIRRDIPVDTLPLGDSSIAARKKYGRYLTYSAGIDSDHPLLGSFPLMAEQAGEMGAELLIYVTPIDYQYLAEFYDAETVRTVKQNVRKLLEFCSAHEVDVLDLSEAFTEQEHFCSFGGAASHLMTSGRELLAGAIADHIRKSNLLSCTD